MSDRHGRERENSVTVEGHVTKIIFRDDENGYSVLLVSGSKRTDPAKVVGRVGSVFEGERLNAQGGWVMDRRYGKQFEADRIETRSPTSREWVEKYLLAIKDIGPFYAKKLIRMLGDGVLDVLDKHPERLNEMPGIKKMARERIIGAWKRRRSLRENMETLHGLELEAGQVAAVLNAYGEDAIRIIRDDPYRLARDIPGIGFRVADQVALRLGLERNAPVRLQVGILYVLLEATRDGHCGLPTGGEEGLLVKGAYTLGVNETDVAEALAREIGEGTVRQDSMDGVPSVFLNELHSYERMIADGLVRRLQSSPPWGAIDSEAAIGWVQTKTGTELSPTQRAALIEALRSKVIVITGGPGVGKTEVVNSLLEILDAKDMEASRCALTKRVAKRFGGETIHGLLKFSGGGKPHRLLEIDPRAKILHRLLEIDPKAKALRRLLGIAPKGGTTRRLLEIDPKAESAHHLLEAALEAKTSRRLLEVDPEAEIIRLLDAQKAENTQHLLEIARNGGSIHYLLEIAPDNETLYRLLDFASEAKTIRLIEIFPETKSIHLIEIDLRAEKICVIEIDLRDMAISRHVAPGIGDFRPDESFPSEGQLGSWSGLLGRFEYNERNPLKCDLVVVDEISMVDVPLMASLVQALDERTALVLVGDVNQIPSVGPGRVIGDIIGSGAVPVVHLEALSRKAAKSQIVVNAHRVNRGEEPQFVPADQGGNCIFVEAQTPEEIVEKIIEVVARRIPQRFEYPSFEVQVLSPTRKGPLGTKSLNEVLRAELNPGASLLERQRGSELSIGDKVMQIENDQDVYNGDIGHILESNPEKETVSIKFDEKKIDYAFSDLRKIMPAYAITIHKSQGSEYPAVVMPLTTQHSNLCKNLLYTAMTRSRGLVVLVGQRDALNSAIRKTTERRRYTKLRERLEEAARS